MLATWLTTELKATNFRFRNTSAQALAMTAENRFCRPRSSTASPP